MAMGTWCRLRSSRNEELTSESYYDWPLQISGGQFSVGVLVRRLAAR